MTANINIQNKPVMPEQAQPVLKAGTYQSKDIDAEHNNVRSIRSAKTVKETDAAKVDKTEESAEGKKSSEQTLDDAVKQLNSFVQSINRNLEFNIDHDSGKTVVRVIDAETDKLIRQIPNEAALSIARQLDAGFTDEHRDPGVLLINLKA